MRNETPQRVQCALCNGFGPWDVQRGWVWDGDPSRLYMLCTTCLDERQPTVHQSTSGDTIFSGKDTQNDLELRIAALERKVGIR